ncbi:hypothetical protein H0B56_20790 [Haloechinothrix sp. YIM 98757]|uniref:Uncharacterized protein n=1 Tax=Haloechinothrix aidingensis TaxID=2752311 RepID=A0A838AFA9_9PSEU|nr:hypothetical protein [Haloechinothrix aidingensis]MBA0127989.1 hypothetical protein [Haloechinothrix aidingensis]
MRTRLANLQERVRVRWFTREEPDALLERSFHDCESCGASVYVLAVRCRECGSDVELRAG